MYRQHRIFCATSWELEIERQEFHSAAGEFNEARAMKRGLLYVPVSLVNIRDKRPMQYVIDENIRECRHYLLALDRDWGPPERDFRRDYRLALTCAADPDLPMSQVAFLLRRPTPEEPCAADLPTPSAEFFSPAEFRNSVFELLGRWMQDDDHPAA